MTHKCASCGADAMPGEKLCAVCDWMAFMRTGGMNSFSLAELMMRKEAAASVALDHGEIGTQSAGILPNDERPQTFDAPILLNCGHPAGALEGDHCRMCREGMA